MKYPIDPQTTETFFGHLIAHDRAQRQMIQALTFCMTMAMETVDSLDQSLLEGDMPEWYIEAQKLIALQKKLKADHETRIFNARNGHLDPAIVKIDSPIDVGAIPPIGQVTYVPGVKITPELDAKLTEAEAEFGAEMSEDELARHFRERPQKKINHGVDMSKKNPFKGMTLQEIEAWEAKQDNSNDIYKIKARVQNAVSATGGALTSVGEMMVNSFVHVAKDLYDFADTLPDKETRIRLIERVRKHESMPATLIAAVAGGVKIKK